MGYRDSDRCLAKVDADEPIFVIRAQDANAQLAIIQWLELPNKLTPEHKAEVEKCLDDISAWQDAHPDRVKRPD